MHLGRDRQFFRVLTFQVLDDWKRHPDLKVHRHGIRTRNLEHQFYLFCADGKRVSRENYVIMHQIDTLGFYEILEMDEVHASWSHAAMFDSDAMSEAKRAAAEAGA